MMCTDVSATKPVVPAKDTVVLCPYCGGGDFRGWLSEVRDRLDYVPGEWSFLDCCNCGSAVISPMPKADALPTFYPPVYTFSPELGQGSWLRRTLADLEYGLFYRPSYAAQVKIVERYIQKHRLQGRQLLDVGCGRGLRLLEFRRRGFDVQGCDFSEEAVKYLQEQHRVAALRGDLHRLDELYRPESFDVVTAFHVLEHVTDVRAVLSSCLQILRPGGILAVAVPLRDSLQAILFRRQWVAVREAPRHVSLPSQQGLMNLCRRVGFDSASMELAADSTISNAATAGMTLSPTGPTTHCYGTRKWTALGMRLLGATAALACVPWALADKWLFHRPAAGILLAQKP